jgi:hypothetical protein
MRHKRSEEKHRTLVMVFAGVAGAVAGMLLIRSLPDLVRYVKIARM